MKKSTGFVVVVVSAVFAVDAFVVIVVASRD